MNIGYKANKFNQSENVTSSIFLFKSCRNPVTITSMRLSYLQLKHIDVIVIGFPPLPRPVGSSRETELNAVKFPFYPKGVTLRFFLIWQEKCSCARTPDWGRSVSVGLNARMAPYSLNPCLYPHPHIGGTRTTRPRALLR